jgi:two-component system response regulator HydG
MSDRILFVDDDQDQCETFRELLSAKGYEVRVTTSPEEAIALAGREDFDVILTDLGMPDLSGIGLCTRMLGIRPDVPIIVVTGHGNLEAAVSAIRAGASDFVTKPVDPKLLCLSIERVVRSRRLENEVKRLREATCEAAPTSGMTGCSAGMKRVEDLITRLGPSDISVLIQGETGTGKELVARAIHAASDRRKGPFVAINCAAVPASLLESELFGHARGAFTDAKTAREGLFVRASGGTLFLDEIGEMPLEMQPKLLRALQERTVRPVGSDVDVPFDTRVVAATHRVLEIEIEEKRFREDLYYRINVVRVDVPPLRERDTDILELAHHFLRRAAERMHKGEIKISPQVATLLLAYDWPGNVRELENCVERASALARLDHLSAEDLPDRIRNYKPDRFVLSVDEPAGILPLEEIDRRYILRALKLLSGNKTRAADLLQIDRRTLYRRLERYETQATPTKGAANVTNGGNGANRSPAAAESFPGID